MSIDGQRGVIFVKKLVLVRTFHSITKVYWWSPFTTRKMIHQCQAIPCQRSSLLILNISVPNAVKREGPHILGLRTSLERWVDPVRGDWRGKAVIFFGSGSLLVEKIQYPISFVFLVHDFCFKGINGFDPFRPYFVLSLSLLNQKSSSSNSSLSYHS